MTAIQCPKCSAHLEVVNPKLDVINHPNMSMLFGLHEVGVTCAACGGYFKPMMIGAQGVQWQWVEDEKPAEVSPLIIPNGLKLVG